MVAVESMASKKENIQTFSAKKRKKETDAPVIIKKPKEDEEEKQISDKPPVQFSVKEFRNQLRSVDGLKWLRDFANYAEWKTSENDVVLDYLRAGGTVGEITSLLDITAQGDLATALPVFRAVYNVLLKIQGEGKEFLDAAKNDIENLMSTYVSTMQAMITLNSPKHRKVVLKLLTSVVTLHAPLGSQILNWFSLTPQQQESFTEPGPMRKAFVMFLLSFFLYGKIWLFRPLIEKKGLLSTIMPNLKFDEAHTVIVLLTVLKDKMVLNHGVPKTLKLNIFNTQTIQSLFQLFDWVGPKGAQKGWKRPLKLAPVDEEELQQVSDATIDFLTILCTCRKNGVVFWDKSIGTGTQMNQLVFTALEAIHKPWEKANLAKLVLKILESSPDLIKGCLARWEPSFEPRPTEGWVQVIDFLIAITESLNPETIVPPAIEVLSPTQLAAAFRSLLLSPAISKHLAAALAEQKDSHIRCHGFRLLTMIAKKMKEFLTVVPTAKKYDNLRENLKNALNVVIPPSKTIVKLWNEELMDADGSLSLPDGKELILADCLLALSTFDPFLLDNPRRLCRTLAKDVVSRDHKIQTALLQAIVILDPSYLEPESEAFQEALKILLTLATDDASRKSCLYTIANMLLNTCLWDIQIHTLDCWLASWLKVGEKGRSVTSKLLALTIKKMAEETSHESDEPTSVLSNAWSVAEELSGGLKKSEKNELSLFLTRLTLETSYISNAKLRLTEEMKPWLLVDVRACLKGDVKAVQKIPDELQVAFLNWLLAEDDYEVDLASFRIDMFDWSSLINSTLHFLRTWVSKNEFNEHRRSKCRQALLLILQRTCPQSVDLLKHVSGDSLLALDPSPSVFFRKTLSLSMGNPVLVQHFSLLDDNELTPWLQQLFETLELDKSRVPSKVGIEWKNSMLKEMKKFVENNGEGTISDGLKFWVTLLRPTVQDLLPLIEKLLLSDMNAEMGRIWVLVVQFLDRKSLKREQILDILKHLCQASLQSPNYDEALESFVRLFPGIVLEISKDFLENLIYCDKVGPSLISVAELCVKESIHKESARQIFKNLKNVKKLTNHRALIAILSSGFLKSGEENSDDVTGDRKLVSDVAPVLATLTWRTLKGFLKGHNDAVLNTTKHLPLVRKLVKIIESSEDASLKKSIEKVISSRIPRGELLPIAAAVAYKTDKSIIQSWLETLCSDAENENSKLKDNADAIKSLVKEGLYSKQLAKFRKTDIWKKFVNETLRNLSTNADPQRWAILESLLSSAAEKRSRKEELTQIFHKTTSHSEFVSVLLSNCPVKDELVGVLVQLVQLDDSVMMLGHVPTYLAAYNATLSLADNRLLQLLVQYERHSGSLLKFEPLFWGQAAISHYSVRGTGGLSLWKQVTMKSVLELLDLEKVQKTLAHFPIQRTLDSSSTTLDPDLYDPAFLIPLFSTLLSPGAVSYCLSFVHSGALSLTIAALSSSDVRMRGAAAVVLHRLHSHLHLTVHSKQKPVWLHLLDIIRFGLTSLDTSPLPGVMSVFLARSALELADPSSPLHMINKYLVAKPALNLYTLPEFDHLFFSADSSYLIHRKWILEVIRDGLKRDTDSNLLMRGSTFQLLLAIFSMNTTPLDHKTIILQIAEKLVRSGPAGKKAIAELGLPSWIRSAAWEVSSPMLPAFHSLLQAVDLCLDKMEKKSSPTLIKGDRERIKTVFRVLSEREQQRKSKVET